VSNKDLVLEKINPLRVKKLSETGAEDWLNLLKSGATWVCYDYRSRYLN